MPRARPKAKTAPAAIKKEDGPSMAGEAKPTAKAKPSAKAKPKQPARANKAKQSPKAKAAKPPPVAIVPPSQPANETCAKILQQLSEMVRA